MSWFKDQLMGIYTDLAENYKKYKDEDKDYIVDDDILQAIAEGGYLSNGGNLDNIKQGSKQYFNYLKYGIKPYQQEEVKEEPIMIEDNNYNYSYETPYSFEYEPYLLNNSNNNYSITFDHEVDRNNTMEIIKEIYNEPIVEEETCDINELIDIVDILTNKISKVKKTIIHYISNYRPIMNQYTGDIDTILIE